MHGRKAVAVLPICYPKQILTAMDILAVEMWGPPGPPRGPEAGRIQTYVCAVVRNCLAFVAGGGADVVDGMLFPHTCDSIQQLATVAPDLGGWSKQTFRYLIPKGEERASARGFVTTELRNLASELKRLTGRPLDEQALVEAIRLHQEIDALRAELLDGRARLAMDDLTLYRLLRRGEYLWPEDHLTELREARGSLRSEPVQRGVPVMISGIVPEPMTIFDVLYGAGVFVAADDYAAVGRRVIRPRSPLPEDPFEALADLHFAAPPCSTRHTDPSRRVDYLENLFNRGGAAGLIIHIVKFCEPDLFDAPLIRKRFEEKGVPVLYLESELESELSGQTVTRIEAFAEMLISARSRQ